MIFIFTFLLQIPSCYIGLRYFGFKTGSLGFFVESFGGNAIQCHSKFVWNLKSITATIFCDDVSTDLMFCDTSKICQNLNIIKLDWLFNLNLLSTLYLFWYFTFIKGLSSFFINFDRCRIGFICHFLIVRFSKKYKILYYTIKNHNCIRN